MARKQVTKHVLDEDTTRELLDALKQSQATGGVLRAVARTVFQVAPGDQLELTGKLELVLKPGQGQVQAKEE